MTPTDHQLEKHDECIAHLRAGAKRIVIKGSAGVGKTTLADYLIKTLSRDRSLFPQYNNGLIYTCAPTNKALSVLQGKITSKVEFKTIHSALKMTRVIRNGQAFFVRGRGKNDDFGKCKIAIVDEVSMLNSDFLGKTIIEDGKEVYTPGFLEDYGFPIIFLGDSKQLSPVGESISPIWIKDYPTVELTEIIRQGEGNPIIELSRDLDLIYFKEPKIINGCGYTYDNAKHILIDNLAQVNGTDELKYLAFTNDEVNSVNSLVRKTIYGDSPKRIELGETIVFNKPYESFYTNKEVKVENVNLIIDNIRIPKYNTKFDAENQPIGNTDNIRLKYYRVNDSFNVMHEDSDKIFKVIVDSLKYRCANHGWDWRGKFYFEEQFANITYNHGITVHKS